MVHLKKASAIFAVVGIMAMAAMIAMPMTASAASFVNRSQGLGDLFLLDKLFGGGNSNVLTGNGTNLGDLIILDKLFPVKSTTVTAAATTQSVAQKVAGRIVIQVQAQGQAWYVNPVNDKRYFLGTPQNAFNVMSQQAVGISNADFDKFSTSIPSSLVGRFVIKTQDSGKMYYINPVGKGVVYVPDANGAANLIKAVGLGISNSDLATITVGS
jgi:hypothetical protein